MRIYSGAAGAASSASPVYTARPAAGPRPSARRTGNRKDAIDCLRRAVPCRGLRATRSPNGPTRNWPPAIARTGGEEVVSGADEPGKRGRLPGRQRPVHPEIATELFLSRKALEFHLGNMYAKYGIQP